MMVLLHPCIPCQHGDHDSCMGGKSAPEGMLGGWLCPCEGECFADRGRELAEHVTPTDDGSHE